MFDDYNKYNDAFNESEVVDDLELYDMYEEYDEMKEYVGYGYEE